MREFVTFAGRLVKTKSIAESTSQWKGASIDKDEEKDYRGHGESFMY
jgi:hypothetical protein